MASGAATATAQMRKPATSGHSRRAPTRIRRTPAFFPPLFAAAAAAALGCVVGSRGVRVLVPFLVCAMAQAPARRLIMRPIRRQHMCHAPMPSQVVLPMPKNAQACHLRTRTPCAHASAGCQLFRRLSSPLPPPPLLRLACAFCRPMSRSPGPESPSREPSSSTRRPWYRVSSQQPPPSVAAHAATSCTLPAAVLPSLSRFALFLLPSVAVFFLRLSLPAIVSSCARLFARRFVRRWVAVWRVPPLACSAALCCCRFCASVAVLPSAVPCV